MQKNQNNYQDDENKENIFPSTNNISDQKSSQNLILQEAPPTDQIPNGHKNMTSYTEEDKLKCPYFQMQQQNQEKAQESLLEEKTNDDEQPTSSSSEDEEGNKKNQKGGCPFMPSERKKNPGLFHLEYKYNIHYISRHQYLLDSDPLLIQQNKKKKIDRKIFNSYPIYLKHTIFHDDDLMKKIRLKEITERFFAYDKFRERGNRYFNKQKITTALYYYERALSCFKWLELIDEEDEKKKLTTFTDNNIKLFDGENLKDCNDIDLRFSMLVNTYLNLGICYMVLYNFDLALISFKDAYKLHQKGSIILLRMAQSVLYNKNSSFQDLKQAQQWLDLSLEIKKMKRFSIKTRKQCLEL
ncbi:hypothetical protein IMG5_144800 [Ichthyophthirius multifiliis]|uniref:Tetratricopeptide repeat protein n=1 Tax=Ichthyophthirius multifiliis TaxID=5932 RepID=G0QXR9_ICHMU|nr:hypothetical protein IMG5_144800 [Ichthyophthirius multifiliis]EGR30006.1 hypothetical protein IMG5_144800 [Ichthyophthirius multifiliis]|eukprot:XP_004031242.1 hypothetical protein IMG5_144800 [Ichthyophthirius multifiliis]